MNDLVNFYLERIAIDSPSEDDLREFTLMLWENYRERVFVYVIRRVRDRNVAADLTQSAFVNAMVALRKVNSRRDNLNFPAWLQMIAGNLVIDFFRKSGRIEYGWDPEPPNDSDGPAKSYPVANDDEPIPESLSRAQELAILSECLESLGEPDKSYVTLCDIREQTQKAVAEQMNLTPPTMLRRLRRARARLRECFESRSLALLST